MTLMDTDRIDLFHPVLLPWLLGLRIMELVNGRSLCCCARVCVCVRLLGRPHCSARSSIPRQDFAVEAADRKRSVRQHGDCG